MHNKRKTNLELLDNASMEAQFSVPIVIIIIIAILIFMLVLSLASKYRTFNYPLISIIALLPLVIRVKNGNVKIMDNKIIVTDWWYVNIHKTYKFDSVANVSLYSFLDMSCIILEINQGNHQNLKKIPILFVENAKIVYDHFKSSIDTIKNDKDVLVELLDETNSCIKQITAKLNTNSNINSENKNNNT